MKTLYQKLKKFKGVHQVLVLEEDDKRKALELERQAEQRVIMGLGQGDNQGVKTALKRDVVMSIITDNEYEWPPRTKCDPYAGGRGDWRGDDR